MPRQAGFDTPGTLHPVTLRGIELRIIVDDDTDREESVDRMGKIAQESETQILPGDRKRRAPDRSSRECAKVKECRWKRYVEGRHEGGSPNSGARFLLFWWLKKECPWQTQPICSG
jgi:hypothetical protein